MVRYSFPVGLFHSLLHAGLIPAHTHNWHTRNRVASDSMPVCLRGQLMGRQSIASASVSDRWRGIWWLRDAQAYQVRYAFQTWNTTKTKWTRWYWRYFS